MSRVGRRRRTWAACALIAQVAAAQDLHVDVATGDDANDGLTPGTAWRTIQKAFDSATPGSTVWISEGTYVEHPVLHVSGLPGQPITFQNEPGEFVSIDGDPILGSTIVTIEDQSHIVIRGLRIQGLITPDAVGILIRATPSGGVEDVTITRCLIRWINWTSDPLVVPGPDDNSQPLIVYGEGAGSVNAVSNIRLDSLNVYENITGFSESISIDGNVDGFVVNECDVHDNTNIGILAAGGYGVSSAASLDNARNGVISRNRCWSNVSTYATSGGIYVDGADSIVIERNTSWENGYGIEVGCEEDGAAQWITVKNNAIFHNRVAGLALGGYDDGTTGQVLNAEVRNNTFLENDQDGTGSGEIYITKATDALFRNNIFSCSAQNILLSREDIAPQAGLLFDYNCWWLPGGAPSLAEVNWGSSTLNGFADYLFTTGFDDNGSFDAPELNDPAAAPPDLLLQGTSICIGSGDPATVIAPGELDLAGQPRVIAAVIDKGAFEYFPVGLPDPAGAWLVLWPNPAADRAHLDMKQRTRSVELRDIHGRLVRSWPGDQRELGLSGLGPGIYALRALTITGARFDARLVKQ